MPQGQALLCLLGFGLSVASIIAGGKVLVTQSGISPLMLVGLQNTAAGAALLLLAWPARSHWRRAGAALMFFTISAFAGIAAPNAIAFFVVPHLGAAVTSMTYLFPPLLTFAFALGLGMERFDRLGLIGLMLGLVGGGFLFWGQGFSAQSALGWFAVAMVAPLLQAAGNIYRSKYWPPEIPILVFAGMIVVMAGIMSLVMALLLGADMPVARFQQRHWLILAGSAGFAAFGYGLFFYLQRRTGPVYVSLGGYVIAAFGLGFGALLFGEAVSVFTLFGAGAVGAGILLYALRFSRAQKAKQG